MKAQLTDGTGIILAEKAISDISELAELNLMAKAATDGNTFWSVASTNMEGFSISPTESMDPNEDGSPINPFLQDGFNMGQYLGTNLAVLFSNFDHQNCPYIILVNRKTGKSIRIIVE